MAGIDRDLLYLYSENARIKLRDLAVLLRKTPQRLKYSLVVMEKGMVVYNPHCIFDYSYFGQMLFRVYFKGGYIREQDKAEILHHLGENPYVVAIYELNGEFDLAIELEAPNPSRFNKELKKVSSLIPSLNTFKVVLNVVTHIYPHTYLVKNLNYFSNVGNIDQEIIVGGDRQVETFNSYEMRVMKCLIKEPRLRLSSLAKQAGVNIKTVISILKNLRKRKIIKGFKYILDTNKLGAFKFRLFLTLHNISQEREEEMLKYLLQIKEVVQVNKTIGDWNLEVDIEALDKSTIKHLISQMREEFKEIIAYFNIIEFYQYYQRSFLPRYLFEEYEKNASLSHVPEILPDFEEEKEEK